MIDLRAIGGRKQDKDAAKDDTLSGRIDIA
jgi:hypothetical protein